VPALRRRVVAARHWRGRCASLERGPVVGARPPRTRAAGAANPATGESWSSWRLRRLRRLRH
jgi:hypothetical protein